MCKGILVLGICVSIYLRLRSSGINHLQTGENGSTYMQSGDSLIGKIDGADPRSKKFN